MPAPTPDQLKAMPPWLARAYRDLGTVEVPGSADSPIIMHLAQLAHVADIVTHDEVPWCAAAVGGWLEDVGVKGSRAATAISYRDWGVRLPPESRIVGAVMWLKPSPGVAGTGHVAFYVGSRFDNGIESHVRLLGGNQHDRVCEADFPVGRISAVRWAPGIVIQPSWVGPIRAIGSALNEPSDR